VCADWLTAFAYACAYAYADMPLLEYNGDIRKKKNTKF